MQPMRNNLFSTITITSTCIFTMTGTTGYCTWGMDKYRSMS